MRITGYVNKQILDTGHLIIHKEAHELPLCSETIVVWCGVGMMGEIGPYYLKQPAAGQPPYWGTLFTNCTDFVLSCKNRQCQLEEI